MNLLKRLAEEAQGNPAPEATVHRSDSQIFKSQAQTPDSVSSSVSNSALSSVGSSNDDSEFSTTNLLQRQRTNVSEAEL